MVCNESEFSPALSPGNFLILAASASLFRMISYWSCPVSFMEWAWKVCWNRTCVKGMRTLNSTELPLPSNRLRFSRILVMTLTWKSSSRSSGRLGWTSSIRLETHVTNSGVQKTRMPGSALISMLLWAKLSSKCFVDTSLKTTSSTSRKLLLEGIVGKEGTSDRSGSIWSNGK